MALITRAGIETVVVNRLSPLMLKAAMAVTYAGANADLNDPIGWALRQAGYSVTDPATVADADVATVTADKLDEVLDLAEYRALETVLGRLDDVDTTLGPRSERLSQLADQVEKKLERLQKRLEKDYGYGVGPLEVGVTTYEFAEHFTGE
jgi:hypothetical protein